MLINYYYANSIIKYPQANSEKYAASLLPNTLYDGGVTIHEPSHMECVGSGRLRNI